jgi:hypothetical protein
MKDNGQKTSKTKYHDILLWLEDGLWSLLIDWRLVPT